MEQQPLVLAGGKEAKGHTKQIGSTVKRYARRNVFWRMLPIVATAFAISIFSPSFARENAQPAQNGKAAQVQKEKSWGEYEAKGALLGAGLLAALFALGGAAGKINDWRKRRKGHGFESNVGSKTRIEGERMFRMRGREGV